VSIGQFIFNMFKASAARRASVDDDAISITSTQSSQYSDEHQYEVDRVLAEKTIKGKKYYLLLWEGYPEHRATWEPRVNIYDPKVLDVWKERKMKESRGIETSFNVERFQAHQDKFLEEKADRHRRRKAKRRRRNISVSDSEQDDADSIVEAAEVNDVVEDDRGMKRKTNSSSKQSEKPYRVRVTGANVQPLNDSSSEAEIPRKSSHKSLGQSRSIVTPEPSRLKEKGNIVLVSFSHCHLPSQ
jgi:chromo domain-containing protein 1